ncbi:MAG: LAGLIDADG family homing endonuclease [Candidatus Nealsonbacteria bacterium]
MGNVYTRHINHNFFKKWNSKMSYVLGYIVADGCIAISKDRKSHPFTLNITSADLKHLYLLKETLESEHKISKKSRKADNNGYQLQIRNHIITKDLMNLGIFPRKTYNLNPIKVPEKYFPDFIRGFFDGDGSVYIYKVNGVPQIKASFSNPSLPFIAKLNQDLCRKMGISMKTIHEDKNKRRKIPLYYIDFYIDDCEKFAEFMYRNNSSLFLLRKCKIFEKWKLIKRRHYIKQNYPSKVGWHLNQKVFT